jgi:hypothetical protein
MSFTSIPNQPIIFTSNTAVDCPGCGGDYKQLLDFNDQVFFQVESTPCPLSQLFPYDTFQGGWGNNLVDGNICSTDINENGIYAVYLTTNYIYQVYQVTFTILTLDQGTLNVEMYGSSSYEITLPGTYTLFFTNPTITGNSITLVFTTPNVDGWIGCLSTTNIKVYGLASSNQMKVGIVDAVTLETVDLVAPLYTIKDNKITVAFDLTDIELGEGCYRLAMTDFCTNTCGQNYIFNGEFRDATGGVAGWTISGTGSVVLSEESAAFNLDESESATITQNQSNDLCDGLQYGVGIFIESRTNVRIYVKVGANQVQVFGTGYQQVLITADGNNPVEILVAEFGGAPAEAIIKYVDIAISDSDIQWDLFSDIINIGDFNDECKYFKIEGCNAEDQFNLAFGGSSFLPAIRLEGRKFRAQYVTEVNNFRFASGRYQTTYVDREKKWTFAFGRLPEYVLDFLSTIFYYDNCYVNGDLYYAIDGEFPDVEYNDADDLGAINIDLALKSSKVRKTICSNTDADCLPSILDSADEPFLLAQDLQRLTTEDSVNLYQEFIL